MREKHNGKAAQDKLQIPWAARISTQLTCEYHQLLKAMTKKREDCYESEHMDTRSM
jgi:hypothetical protein